jgi:hypothetical protein
MRELAADRLLEVGHRSGGIRAKVGGLIDSGSRANRFEDRRLELAVPFIEIVDWKRGQRDLWRALKRRCGRVELRSERLAEQVPCECETDPSGLAVRVRSLRSANQ